VDQAFDAVCHADEDAEGHHFGHRPVPDLADVSAAREHTGEDGMAGAVVQINEDAEAFDGHHGPGQLLPWTQRLQIGPQLRILRGRSREPKLFLSEIHGNHLGRDSTADNKAVSN
jgi:hypothetical protein